MNEELRPQPYSLRIDPSIRAKLEAAAKAGNRSLHAEIMMRLEASLQADEGRTDSHPQGEDLKKVVRELIQEELDKRASSTANRVC